MLMTTIVPLRRAAERVKKTDLNLILISTFYTQRRHVNRQYKDSAYF